MRPRFESSLAALLAFWSFTFAAHAQQGAHAYALVVGSNRGGAGQMQLAFAQRDARRVADIVHELGRTPRDHVEMLSDPRASEVEQALGRMREKLAAHAAAGEQAQLLFYYSGHARADALSLGEEELPLARLRTALRALPSTLTVVVLDACQSGAFSGVKGAAPAADFSVSSVANLQSSGIAVMASSTGTELSQESRELGSSYFTHHLLVALRGAADVDRNGRVSLDEAYRYAYDHTLADTARTRVGLQHATLETELTGRGDVPLSYPIDADAQLALPAEVEGRVLVQRDGGGAVMAELYKAVGTPLSLALPSGRYDALVRSGDSARSCPLELMKGEVATLELARCQVIELAADTSKQGGERERATESWFVEAGPSLRFDLENDGYERTLREFGYEPRPWPPNVGYDVALGAFVSEHWAVVGRFALLEYEDWASGTNPFASHGGSFGYATHGVTAGVRVRMPVARRWLALFAEYDVGLGFSSTLLVEGTSGDDFIEAKERQRGFVMRGLGGITIGLGRHFGVYVAGGFTYAPILENELGDRHGSGGISVVQGLRLNGVKGWW